MQKPPGPPTPAKPKGKHRTPSKIARDNRKGAEKRALLAASRPGGKIPAQGPATENGDAVFMFDKTRVHRMKERKWARREQTQEHKRENKEKEREGVEQRRKEKDRRRAGGVDLSNLDVSGFDGAGMGVESYEKFGETATRSFNAMPSDHPFSSSSSSHSAHTQRPGSYPPSSTFRHFNAQTSGSYTSARSHPYPTNAHASDSHPFTSTSHPRSAGASGSYDLSALSHPFKAPGSGSYGRPSDVLYARTPQGIQTQMPPPDSAPYDHRFPPVDPRSPRPSWIVPGPGSPSADFFLDGFGLAPVPAQNPLFSLNGPSHGPVEGMRNPGQQNSLPGGTPAPAAYPLDGMLVSAEEAAALESAFGETIDPMGGSIPHPQHEYTSGEEYATPAAFGSASTPIADPFVSEHDFTPAEEAMLLAAFFGTSDPTDESFPSHGQALVSEEGVMSQPGFPGASDPIGGLHPCHRDDYLMPIDDRATHPRESQTQPPATDERLMFESTSGSMDQQRAERSVNVSSSPKRKVFNPFAWSMKQSRRQNPFPIPYAVKSVRESRKRETKAKLQQMGYSRKAKAAEKKVMRLMEAGAITGSLASLNRKTTPNPLPTFTSTSVSADRAQFRLNRIRHFERKKQRMLELRSWKNNRKAQRQRRKHHYRFAREFDKPQHRDLGRARKTKLSKGKKKNRLLFENEKRSYASMCLRTDHEGANFYWEEGKVAKLAMERECREQDAQKGLHSPNIRYSDDTDLTGTFVRRERDGQYSTNLTRARGRLRWMERLRREEEEEADEDDEDEV